MFLVMEATKNESFYVNSNPANAMLFIDGKWAGYTPGEVTIIRWEDHTFRLVKKGYEDTETIVSGLPPRLNMDFTLVPLPAPAEPSMNEAEERRDQLRTQVEQLETQVEQLEIQAEDIPPEDTLRAYFKQQLERFQENLEEIEIQIQGGDSKKILALPLLEKDIENLKDKFNQFYTLMMVFISAVVMVLMAVIGFLIHLIRAQNKGEKSISPKPSS